MKVILFGKKGDVIQFYIFGSTGSSGTLGVLGILIVTVGIKMQNTGFAD